MQTDNFFGPRSFRAGIQIRPSLSRLSDMRRLVFLGVLASAVTLSGCGDQVVSEHAERPVTPAWNKAASENQTAETRKMAERLSKLATVSDNAPSEYWHSSDRQANILFKQIQASSTPSKRLQLAYAKMLLDAGRSQESIDFISNNLIDPNTPLDDQVSEENLGNFFLLGLANLRLGEQENCCKNHNAQSCILPLQAVAKHRLPEGSRNAAEIFELIYNFKPNPTTRWLINLAHMTLGQYPQGVNDDHLINFPDWKSERKDFPVFRDVATDIDVAEVGLAGGVCMEDFNGDDLLDLFITSYGMRDQVKLFLNDGRGGFHDATKESGLEGIVSGLNCIHADYDNDGDVDIFILRGAWFGKSGQHPNSLLRNDGNGRFDDVTESAGVLSYKPTQSAVWTDVNKDGYIDLFVANESSVSDRYPCELYLNQRDGTFVEATDTAGLGKLHGYFKGVAAGDIDNDGWPDIYLSDMGGLNRLLRNVEGKFVDVTQSANVSGPIYSFPTWFWDVDNDGDQDIFVSGYDLPSMADLSGDFALELMGKPVITAKPKLYLNDGRGVFTNESRDWQVNRTMYAMGANFGDLDNDGNLDFYVGTGSPQFQSVIPNRMFRNTGENQFEEVTSAGGFGHIQKGHGIAFGDLDGDGDQDIYAVMGGAVEGDVFANILYENPTTDQNWITLQLVGVSTNRSAIGTRLELTLEDGRKLYRTVGTGGSFGASSLQQEIGIGSSATVKELKIYWQNGPMQSFTGLAVNRKYRITEGQSEVEEIEQKYIPFRKAMKSQHVEQTAPSAVKATADPS